MFIAQYIPSILLLLMSCMSDDAMSPFGWQRGSRYFLSLLSVERLKKYSSRCIVHFYGNGQGLGGCYLTLFFILSARLFDFFIFDLWVLLIILSIAVGIGITSFVGFGIVVVVCNCFSYNDWDPFL